MEKVTRVGSGKEKFSFQVLWSLLMSLYMTSQRILVLEAFIGWKPLSLGGQDLLGHCFGT